MYLYNSRKQNNALRILEKMLSGPLDTLNENQVVSKFLVDSNQAVQFKLVRKVEDLSNDETTFPPGMSHQIFGPKVSIVKVTFKVIL